MHVTHLSVTAFEGVPSFEAPLSRLTLIAGDNGSGKSSLLEALRFALTGEVDRVKLKKDLPLLVTEGATKARVSITLDDGERITGLLPTGKHLNPIDPRSPDAIALDPARFMGMKDDERRTLIYALANEGDRDVIKIARERLADSGVPQEKVDAILPSLRIGFPEACAQAMQRATEARAAWRGVTGEAYGVQKAEGWTASTPITRPTNDERATARAELDEAKQELTDAAERVGQISAAMDPDQRRHLQQQVDNLERYEANLTEGEKALAEQKAREAELTETAAQTIGLCFECPCCGKPLRYSGGQVFERTADVGEASVAGQALQDLKREIAATEQKLGIIRARVTAARDAAARLEAAGGEGDPDAAEQLRLALTDAQARVDAAHTAMSDLTHRDRHVDALEQKAIDAGKHHTDAKAWAEIATLFAPDGLPNELLGWALKPVNDALRNGPDGFPIVQIRGDMTLTIDGRPYALCSESEQWRADVMLATWIAGKTGTGIVLVDRIDVLAPGWRVPMLEWMADRTEAGTHQFVVAGTFHAAPKLDFATVYWMGDVVAQARAA